MMMMAMAMAKEKVSGEQNASTLETVIYYYRSDDNVEIRRRVSNQTKHKKENGEWGKLKLKGIVPSQLFLAIFNFTGLFSVESLQE